MSTPTAKKLMLDSSFTDLIEALKLSNKQTPDKDIGAAIKKLEAVEEDAYLSKLTVGKMLAEPDILLSYDNSAVKNPSTAQRVTGVVSKDAGEKIFAFLEEQFPAKPLSLDSEKADLSRALYHSQSPRTHERYETYRKVVTLGFPEDCKTIGDLMKCDRGYASTYYGRTTEGTTEDLYKFLAEKGFTPEAKPSLPRPVELTREDGAERIIEAIATQTRRNASRRHDGGVGNLDNWFKYKNQDGLPEGFDTVGKLLDNRPAAKKALKEVKDQYGQPMNNANITALFKFLDDHIVSKGASRA